MSIRKLATIIFGTSYYATPHCGRWLIPTLHVIFWLYTGISLLLALLLGWWIPYTRTTPAGHYPIVNILPYFPPMLSGTTMQVFGLLMFVVVLVQSGTAVVTTGLPPPARPLH